MIYIFLILIFMIQTFVWGGGGWELILNIFVRYTTRCKLSFKIFSNDQFKSH